MPGSYWKGHHGERITSQVILYMGLCLAVIVLAYYIYQSFRSTMGWEEVYVCIIERERNAILLADCENTTV